MGGIWVLSYVVSNKIKTPDELSDILGLPCIGVLKKTEDGRRGIDGCLEKFYRKGICYEKKEHLKEILQRVGDEKIFLVSEGDLSELVGQISTEDKNIRGHRLLAEEIEDVQKEDAVLFLVTLEKTTVTTVRRELEIASLLGCHVMGYVAVM